MAGAYPASGHVLPLYIGLSEIPTQFMNIGQLDSMKELEGEKGIIHKMKFELFAIINLSSSSQLFP